MPELGQLLSFEYGAALPAEQRAGHGFPVFGSNGEVGRHDQPLVDGPGIVVGRKGSVGKVGWSDEPFWPIDTTYWVKCGAEQRRWIYWLLSLLPLSDLDSSTGVPGLNRNDAYELTVFEPPTSDEKSKIADVLDTVDATIRHTEAIVEKLKQVKQGLLHDLLTRGIDANGELRPLPSHAPHLYKASSMGLIPVDWTPSCLGAEATFQSGYAFKEHELSVDGMRVVRISNLHKPEFPYWRYSGRVKQGWVVEDGDLLFSWAGVAASIDAYLYRGETALLNQHIYNLCMADKVRRHWVFCCLTAQLPKLREGIEGGAGQLHLTKAKIQQIQIAIPGPVELAAIVHRLQCVDERIAMEVAGINKLMLVKAGLMNDLLTGRVRVTSLLDAMAA